MNNDFWVTRDAICQWFSLITSSLVTLTGKSLARDQKIVIHGNTCVILYIISRKVATHYCNVIMGAVASQITSPTIVYSTVYSDADQRKHQSSASLAFVRGTHRGPVNSPHKWPVTRKMFPLEDVIMRVWISNEMLAFPLFRRLCWLMIWGL